MFKKKEPRLRWSGSNAAVREHEEAVRLHPPKPKPKPPKGKHKHGQKRKPGSGRFLPNQQLAKLPYREYLQTDWWRQKRREKLRSTRYRCERCRRPATQVHHLRYDTLGCEKNKHLESLCGGCHALEHESLIQANDHIRAIARGG